MLLYSYITLYNVSFEQFQCCGVTGMTDYKNFADCAASKTTPCAPDSINNVSISGCLYVYEEFQNLLVYHAVKLEFGLPRTAIQILAQPFKGEDMRFWPTMIYS